MGISHKTALAFASLVVLALARPANCPAAQNDAAEAPAAQAGPAIVVYTKDNAPPAPKLADLERRTSVSRHGITWTFAEAAPVGRFVNGDWYVVGPVTVTTMDPKPVYGDEVRNGSMLNPPAKLQHTAFDSRLPHPRWFHPELVAKLPLAVKPGDCLMSAMSLDKPRSGGRPVKSYSILTCLAEPVPADALRPGYCDREQTIYLARNLRRDLLPTLPRVEGTPEIAKSVELFERPWDEMSFLEGAQAQYQQGGYGRGVCQVLTNACLLLALDFPAEEKEPLLVGLLERGLDLWSMARSEGFTGWPTLGGWGSGRKWNIVFAGIMLGDERMASPTRTYPYLTFQEDNQTLYDTCWTGAGVVYGGHQGWRNIRHPSLGWQLYENVHPSRWTNWIGTSYRTNMTSSTWVGQALAIRLLKAEKEWNHDAFLDYCDRWMYEPDPGYRNPLRFSTQGCAWDPFAEAMWKAYRENLPEIPGRDNSPRPHDGWRKTRELKGPAVEVGPNRELRVGTKPLLPIMIWAEHPGRIDDALAIGANVVAEGSFETVDNFGAFWKANVHNDAFLDALAAKGLYGVFGGDARTVGHPALLGWIHVDRPDDVLAATAGLSDKEVRKRYPGYFCVKAARDNNSTPELKGMPDHLLLVRPACEWMKRMDAGRPAFLTVGEAFLKAAIAGRKDFCADFVQQCDAIGCDAPAGQAGAATPAQMAWAVATLSELAPGKPVYAWVTTRAAGDGPAPKAGQVRAQVWSAIIAGATGIGYRGFEGFDVKVKPDEAMMAELKAVNARLASLAPAILAPPEKTKIAIRIEGNPPCHVRATEHDGILTLFAQNADAGEGPEPRGGKAAITVDGLRAGTSVEVVGENRTLTAADGGFSDDFAPLAEHVYRFSP